MDLKTKDNPCLTAHCPNTGSMKNLLTEGAEAAYIDKSQQKTKLDAGLEYIKHNNTWVCVNTMRANQIIKEALENRTIPEFKFCAEFKKEVSCLNSKFDFCLFDKNKQPHWLEVKSVTLNQGRKALFPDSVTTRGQKHLKDLIEISRNGGSSYMLYLIMRSDCKSFSPATDIDPDYSELLSQAKQQKVTLIAYSTKCTLSGIKLHKKLPIIL